MCQLLQNRFNLSFLKFQIILVQWLKSITHMKQTSLENFQLTQLKLLVLKDKFLLLEMMMPMSLDQVKLLRFIMEINAFHYKNRKVAILDGDIKFVLKWLCQLLQVVKPTCSHSSHGIPMNLLLNVLKKELNHNLISFSIHLVEEIQTQTLLMFPTLSLVMEIQTHGELVEFYQVLLQRMIKSLLDSLRTALIISILEVQTMKRILKMLKRQELNSHKSFRNGLLTIKNYQKSQHLSKLNEKEILYINQIIK